MAAQELTITASLFKAKCLSLLNDLAEGRLRRIRITKRGKVVGELSPPPPEQPLFGCMRDMITFVPGVDLTEPVFDEEWDAEKGILFHGDPGNRLLEKDAE